MAVIPLTAQELMDFVQNNDFSVSVAGHWSAEYSREVMYDPVTSTYTVWDHAERIKTTIFSSVAAEAFNAIPPRR
jgi:hypothetical protein